MCLLSQLQGLGSRVDLRKSKKRHVRDKRIEFRDSRKAFFVNHPMLDIWKAFVFGDCKIVHLSNIELLEQVGAQCHDLQWYPMCYRGTLSSFLQQLTEHDNHLRLKELLLWPVTIIQSPLSPPHISCRCFLDLVTLSHAIETCTK